ncbi:hypothetical protein Glove_198g58 [Diversispora epigaea]|uniref:Uncharacterized protein n=1 Tax=Diversispora epigaea TaxID=1348612 RepID=A0A397INK8_9GLOM|nr:hypothetical protein Glove_198g58 [Diversispora epigaea]
MSKKRVETFSLTSSSEKDSLENQQIVTFTPETHEFKLYDLSSSKPISTLESGINGKHLCWSKAISDCVEDSKNECFITLSCFDVKGHCNDTMYGDDESDLESGDKYLRPLSTTDVNEIYTSSIGSVIKFLDSDNSPLKTKKVIIIVNACKETMNNLNRNQRFFSRSSMIELPKQLSIRFLTYHPS